MLVDFHGDQKPAVMTRTWPNLINTEGVRGMEWSKWSWESEPAAQREPAIYAYVPWTVGLHTRCHAQCHPQNICANQSAANGVGHAVPAVGNVCGVRSATADVIRYAV